MAVSRVNKTASRKAKNHAFSKDLDFASTQNVSLVENRHQQIVDGACRLFFKKGYHPTTMREIANACGMSIGQLYHYISCKEDVLYLVMKHMQDLWYTYLKRSSLEQINDPMERLRKALARSIEFMIENKKLVQFMYSESKYLDKKYYRIFIRMHHDNVVGFWRRLLDDINKTRPIKNDLDFLSSLTAYLLAFLALSGWTLNEKENEQHADTLVGFILKGLGVG